MDQNTRKALQLELILRQRQASKKFIQTYENDTPAFVWDLIDWDKVGSNPTPYQSDIWALSDFRDRVGVMAPRGAGKSTSGSLWVIKHTLMNEIMGEDFKVVTTAGKFDQLEKYLWPEIRLWIRYLRWDKIPHTPWNHRQIFKTKIDVVHGEAFAANADNPGLIEGAHAKHVYFLYDEAKSIPDGTFNAIEGTFANANPEKGQLAKLLAISTPHFPEGRFWQIMTKQPGYEDWFPKFVTKEELIAAGRITEKYVEDRANQWGKDSAIYKMHVEGQFPESSEEGVIPRAWVQDAVERYLEIKDRIAKGEMQELAVTSIGADPADEGRDLSIYARKHGNLYWEEFVEVPKVKRQNVVEMANALIREIELHKDFHLSIDTNGVGSGVYAIVNDWLDKENRRQLYPVVLDAFVASARALDDWQEARTDKEGLYRFADRRSAAWWGFREKLNPRSNPTIALPPNPKLIKQLTAPRWRELTGGVIKVESKDELRKASRLGESTDLADCVIGAEDKDFNTSGKIGFFVL